jgi:hypothetical protein
MSKIFIDRANLAASPELWDRLWDVAFPRDLVAAACAMAGHRSLTRAQWAADVPSEPFEPTCP